MSHIYYVGVYDSVDNEAENRRYFLAATNKMKYIVSAMERKGHTVEIVSPSNTSNHRFHKGKIMPLGERSCVRLFDTWSSSSRVLRVLGRWITSMECSLYLLTHLKKDDMVLVYHALPMMRRITWLKRLRKVRLFMEVEEIYGDVSQNHALSQKEIAYFQIADGYLFPAIQLNEKINRDHKPYALIHGTYQAEPERDCRFDDGKIHCVYAGTLDPRKGGAAKAAEAARYLPENYHMHILGFGSEQEIRVMEQLVQALQQECRCGITYDGCLKGEDYTRFLQSCQIGLSTQDPNAAFNDTSFPSKILSYMANGLQVVTARIPVVRDSAIGDMLYYYEEASPEAIAEAVLRVQTGEQQHDGRARLRKLDADFCGELEKLWEVV